MPRTMDGKLLPKTNVVAADVIAALSGVNRSSANKVIFALNMLKDVTGHSFEELLDMESIPTADPDQHRVDMTDEYVLHISGAPAARPYMDTVRLRRFAHR